MALVLFSFNKGYRAAQLQEREQTQGNVAEPGESPKHSDAAGGRYGSVQIFKPFLARPP